MNRLAKSVFCLLMMTVVPTSSEIATAQAYKYRIGNEARCSKMHETVVGCTRAHRVTPNETLLDIARNYGLGFNELQILYPWLDPWVPTAGLDLMIPTEWVLPSTRYEGVVINLAELRLYRFFPQIEMVKTYPIGIGDLGSETPEGIYRISEKETYPVWVIPDSMRESYDVIEVPPGPKNPLGSHWIGLSRKGYGIHGTNFSWGVGRLVSHGCIRLYPEDIAQLFQEVSIGTSVQIIYEPVKIGIRNEQVFAEVHPDVYGKVDDMEAHTRKRLKALGFLNRVSVEKTKAALQKKSGVPVRIGTIQEEVHSLCLAAEPIRSSVRKEVMQ